MLHSSVNHSYQLKMAINGQPATTAMDASHEHHPFFLYGAVRGYPPLMVLLRNGSQRYSMKSTKHR